MFAYLLDVVMQNAWLFYRMTTAAQVQPMDQLEFTAVEEIYAYFRCHALDRSSFGRPLGRPKKLNSRVPTEVRTDPVGHYMKEIETQRPCAVCATKV